MGALPPALRACLREPPSAPAADDVATWWPQWQRVCARWRTPAERALAGGFAADRVGWAFAAGYQAALRALHPALPDDRLAALCVTEAGGNRPRDVLTRIAPQPDGTLRIDGAKRWTTLGPASGLLLVVGRWADPAAPEPDAARPALRVVLLPGDAPGLTLQAMPDTPFVPEVPHAQVRLDGVPAPASALLPGDGYTRVVKPFRTLEDLHVTLAVAGHLLREARAQGWPAAFAERLVALITLLSTLAAADPADAAGHAALAGALHWAQACYDEATALWAATPDAPAARRWVRDTRLFATAGAARVQRAARAWERLAAGDDTGAD